MKKKEMEKAIWDLQQEMRYLQSGVEQHGRQLRKGGMGFNGIYPYLPLIEQVEGILDHFGLQFTYNEAHWKLGKRAGVSK